MTLVTELPEPVVALLRSGTFAQYATVNAAGEPIDTPVLCFPEDDLSRLSLATGLAYPAKAERARRNPKVGLYLEGGPDDPVVSIAGMAAVRDADLQGNVNRYLAEASYTLPHAPDWSHARKAIWYWTRILVEIVPARILWWDNPAAMNAAPRRWQAPAGTVFPRSDPAPPKTASRAARWDERPWRELASQALGRGAAGHLSLLDAEGFPLPIRASTVELRDDCLELAVPGGAPWSNAGPACLTFGGIETFLGRVDRHVGRVRFAVTRTLPIFPMTEDMTQLWDPTDDTRRQLMRRLEEELQRRGQPLPEIAATRPPPSAGYRRRMARLGIAIPGQ
jgi:hypothetical protein